MDKGRFLIETHMRTGRPIAELAKAHGVHRSWPYKLLARYRREGVLGLEARSRRPLLARRTVTSTNGRAEVDLPFVYNRVAPIPTRYAGSGPFRTDQLPAAIEEDQLEVRVWSSGGGPTDGYSVDLGPAGH